MRRKRTLGGLAAAAVLTLVGVLGTAAPASAEYTHCLDVTGGLACWHTYGDWFSVHDAAADGAHVEVRWQSWGRSGTCIASGNGDYQKCDYDLKEGYQIKWYLEIWDGNTYVRGKHRTDCTDDVSVCI